MKKNAFSLWCIRATGKIRYAPDRATVHAELCAHLEDHRDALLAQGLTEEEATRKALEAMGDPEQIAPQLAAIHRPFWGYLYTFLRTLLILCIACIALISLQKIIFLPHYHEVQTPYFDADNHIPSMKEQVCYTRPNAKQNINGYRMVLTEAAVWADYGPDYIFYCQMKVRVSYPWLDEPQIEDHFWAEDSLGNVYCTRLEGYTSNDPQALLQSLYCSNGIQTGPMTYIYEFQISDFIYQDVQWLDIHYSRDGQDIIWRIDLAGGAEE